MAEHATERMLKGACYGLSVPKEKRSPKKKSKARASGPAAPCLYLGCFVFDEPGEENHTGSFQIVLEATSPEEAVERFRKRLRQLRTTSQNFDSPITIYSNGFVMLSGSFKEGLLVNWESRPRTEPDYSVLCLVPEQGPHDGAGFHFVKKDGDDDVFVDFGGFKMARALEKTRGDAVGQSKRPLLPITTRRQTGAASSDARPLAPEAAQRERQQRAAEREEGRRARAAAKNAKKKRRDAIDATLSEIRGPRQK